MMDSDLRSLESIDLLTGFDAQALEDLAKTCIWRNFSAEEQIIDQQSDSRDVYFVVKGSVRIANYSISGQMVTLDDLTQGDLFGELAAIDNLPRSASVVALTDCQVVELSQARFLTLLETYPSAARKIMLRLTRGIRTSTERIIDLSTLGASNRIHAEILRRVHKAVDAGDGQVISPPPAHIDIASRVNTTRETVSRAIADLARRNIVEKTKNSLIVNDLERLQSLVEEVRDV